MTARDGSPSDVHSTHCCPGSCKYGDQDCRVATGQVDPEYPCEDCYCAVFYPNLVAEADAWWAALPEAEKRSIYRFRGG